MERQEKYIKKALKEKNPFLPENGCPIRTEVIHDAVAVIYVDTQWFLTDWDRHPTINDDCAIKSRAKFFLELEDAIKDNRNRTLLIAMHHPMATYGPHGGQFSLKQQLYPKKMPVPLPGLGTVINLLRKTTGASTQDVQNKRYTQLRKRVFTLAQYAEKVIFVSGHEHTLQYIVESGVPQIVSGSGAKKGVARVMNGSKFATGHRGYAVLEVYADGSSQVRYFADDKGKERMLFQTMVKGPSTDQMAAEDYPEDFPARSAPVFIPKMR